MWKRSEHTHYVTLFADIIGGGEKKNGGWFVCVLGNISIRQSRFANDRKDPSSIIIRCCYTPSRLTAAAWIRRGWPTYYILSGVSYKLLLLLFNVYNDFLPCYQVTLWSPVGLTRHYETSTYVMFVLATLYILLHPPQRHNPLWILPTHPDMIELRSCVKVHLASFSCLVGRVGGLSCKTPSFLPSPPPFFCSAQSRDQSMMDCLWCCVLLAKEEREREERDREERKALAGEKYDVQCRSMHGEGPRVHFCCVCPSLYSSICPMIWWLHWHDKRKGVRFAADMPTHSKQRTVQRI